MHYRVFVAATKKDLDSQRAYVTKQLRDAGLLVDPMENWPADAAHPAALSAKRTAGCHFCVALVGFQRGSIAQRDPHELSITQLEIDAANKNGAKVLAFLLRDSPANRQAWPPEFNQLADERVAAWRSDLQRELTCGFFDAGTMPEVLPAVTRQIIQWEQGTRRKLLAGIAAIAFSLLLLVAAFGLMARVRDWTLSHLLAYNDPIVFQNSRDGFYKVARLLEGRADILGNTNFGDELLDTHQSFDMFANTFITFRDHWKTFETLAQRGVHLRFVVTDFSESNRANWEAFLSATGGGSALKDETLPNARNLRDQMLSLKKLHPREVDLRLNRKPIFYTLWIRDPDAPTALSHLGVNCYSDKSLWPAFRMSRRTGSKELKFLQDQFEIIWKDAIPAS
jgi:hypothetical protein